MTAYKIIIGKHACFLKADLVQYVHKIELLSSLHSLLPPVRSLYYWLTALLGFHEKPEISSSLLERHGFLCLPQKLKAHHLFGLKYFHS